MTSSSRMQLVYLSASELHILDTLAGTLLMQTDLPASMMDACGLLRTHGFARVRNVTKHGQPSMLAFDITDEGKTYLIRQYKNRGAHV
jgi:hypothetical protein